jgi:hypothetical protein
MESPVASACDFLVLHGAHSAEVMIAWQPANRIKEEPALRNGEHGCTTVDVGRGKSARWGTWMYDNVLFPGTW